MQAQHHVDTAKLAKGIEDFCAWGDRSLDSLDFGQRRKLVELLIGCVIVGDGTVEIRYVVPTSSKGEEVPFCHLHSNYLGVRSAERRCSGIATGAAVTMALVCSGNCARSSAAIACSGVMA